MESNQVDGNILHKLKSFVGLYLSKIIEWAKQFRCISQRVLLVLQSACETSVWTTVFFNVESYKVLQVPNGHIDHWLIDNNLQDTCNNYHPSNQTRNLVERNSIDELQVSFYVSISVNLLSSLLGAYFIYYTN